MIGNEPIYVVGLENYLELDDSSKTKRKNLQSSPCILLKSDSMKFALLVDAVIEKNEVIIKPFEGIIKRVRNVTGVTILDSGEVCIILNPRDLVDSILKKSMNTSITKVCCLSNDVRLSIFNDSNIIDSKIKFSPTM
jgi:two-component system chemotaxis sensor kinase CheA